MLPSRHLSDLNLFKEKGMEDWEKVSRSPSRAEKGKDKVAQDLTRRELEEENRRLRAQAEEISSALVSTMSSQGFSESTLPRLNIRIICSHVSHLGSCCSIRLFFKPGVSGWGRRHYQDQGRSRQGHEAD